MRQSEGPSEGPSGCVFFAYVSQCVYTAHLSDTSHECVSPSSCVCMFACCERALCCIHASYTACVSHQRAAQSAKNHQFKRTKCKTNRNINHACVSEPTLGSLHLYFGSVFVCAVCEIFIMHNIAKPVWIYKSFCSVAKYHCLLGYFSRDHLNKRNSRHHKKCSLATLSKLSCFCWHNTS